MRTLIILGALLIVFGIAVLVNQGMDFSTRGRTVNLGSLEITHKQPHHVSPVLGVLACVAGMALVVVGTKKP